MKIKGTHKARSGFLFISGSTHRRIPLFRYRRACDIFLKTLEAYREKYALRIHAYALMPDHYHLLLWFPPEHDLVDLLRDFKSLVGGKIVEWLKREKLDALLAHFQLKNAPRRTRDARYCILQYNSYIKSVVGSSAMEQTLNYIHQNPVREGLVESPEEYPYSSGGAYAGKRFGPVKVGRLESL